MSVEEILGTHRRPRIADVATLAACIDECAACAATCTICADACLAECERHAHHHEHCRLSAEECRRCERACDDLLAALGGT